MTSPTDAPRDAPTAHYQGLLVDWGGVMTTDVFVAFADFGADEGIGRDAVVRLFRGEPKARELLIGLETGVLADAEFESAFAGLLGVRAENLIERMLGRVGSDGRMRAAVATARRAGVRTGLISNSWGTSTYPVEELRELFDGVVISGDVGVRKPSRKIYELGAQAIGLRPEQCVFVDDLAQNLVPARELGMGAIHHQNTDTTLAELARLLGVGLQTEDNL
jgi:putative hydrolase of the HAD superfamily